MQFFMAAGEHRQRIIWKIVIIGAFLLFGSGIHASAFDDAARLTYLTENFAPFNYVENGELKGFSVELLKIIWKELDIKPKEIQVYPWARAYSILENQPDIVLFTTAKTKERAASFKWVGPITKNTRTAFIALKERRIRIGSLDVAKKYRVGIIRNDAAEQVLLSSGFPKEKIEPVSRFEQNIKKIYVGRIDLIAYDEYSFYHIMKAKDLDQNDFETVYQFEETLPCFAFSKNVSDSLIQKFQHALIKIKQGDAFQELVDKYFK